MNEARYHYLRPEVLEKLGDEDFFATAKGEATRFAYARAIIDVGEADPNVVVLDADVAKSIKTTDFRERFPERSFNFGIAEQNMMRMAPRADSIRAHLCRLCQHGADRWTASLPRQRKDRGTRASRADGVTHQARKTWIMRGWQLNSDRTGDSVSWRGCAAGMDRSTWLSRSDSVLYTDDFPFEIGKSVTVRDGSDLTIIANRDLVAHALVAAELLADEGLDVRVIDCHCVKPLDVEAVLKAARETGAIVTAENNVIFGGLGSAVAEVLVENYPIPMRRIGVRDTFAESGPYMEVIEKYGLTYPHIMRAAHEVLAHRRKFDARPFTPTPAWNEKGAAKQIDWRLDRQDSTIVQTSLSMSRK